MDQIAGRMVAFLGMVTLFIIFQCPCTTCTFTLFSMACL